MKILIFQDTIFFLNNVFQPLQIFSPRLLISVINSHIIKFSWLHHILLFLEGKWGKTPETWCRGFKISRKNVSCSPECFHPLLIFLCSGVMCWECIQLLCNLLLPSFFGLWELVLVFALLCLCHFSLMREGSVRLFQTSCPIPEELELNYLTRLFYSWICH